MRVAITVVIAVFGTACANQGDYNPNACTPSPAVSHDVATIVNPPTWSWHGCASGALYRIILDDTAKVLRGDGDVTPKTTYAPGEALSIGTHTLYVSQSDGQGGWSRPLALKMVILDAPPFATATNIVAGSVQPNSADPNGTALLYDYPSFGGTSALPEQLAIAAEDGSFSPFDVVQQNLGDCYLNAVLASIANAAPKFLNQSVAIYTNDAGEPQYDENGYPLYALNMYYRDEQAKYHPWTYVTDARFPSSQGFMVYNAATLDTKSGKLKIGAALLEKGFAALSQYKSYLESIDPNFYQGTGYYTIGMGGFPQYAMPVYNGQAAQVAKGDSLRALVAQAGPNRGVAVTAFLSRSAAELPLTLPSGATVVADPSDSSRLIYRANDGTRIPLLNIHVYSFLQSDGATLTWRNPWGTLPGPQGVFKMPLQDSAMLFRNFANTTVALSQNE